MRVLFTVPFFAPAVARLPIVFTDDPAVPTACTDGKQIMWSGKWFDSLPDNVLPTVLCHEAAHCLLGHLWRVPPNPDWKRWNVATDHLVNLMLKEFGAQVTQRGLADPFPFPDPPEAFHANPAFRDKSEEWVYKALEGQTGGDGDGPVGPGGCGGQSTNPGGKQNPSGQPQPGQGPGKPAPGSMPSFGDMQQPASSLKTAESSKLENSWKQTMINSVTSAQKGRGNVPGGLERFVDHLVSNKVPWYEYVRSWLHEKATDDWDFMKPSPYYSGTDFLMPSLESERLGQIVFGKDSSGSIDMDVFAAFVAEEQAFLDECRPSKIIDVVCDTRVHRVKEYTAGDVIDTDAPGGGGTSFVPIFDHVATLPELPKCIVVLTDMDGTFPDNPPDCPVLWVNYGRKGQEAPFGDVIDVEA